MKSRKICSSNQEVSERLVLSAEQSRANYAAAEEKDEKLMSSEGLEATEEEMQEVLRDLDDASGEDAIEV